MNYDKIGSFIQQKRKSKNLTQKQLADKLGVTDRAISKWERGQGCPDVSILEILSKELDCSILELLKGREIENEVIPITEADDYIKEGMKISELKFKNIFSRVIEIALVFIILLLGYLNIIQMIYIDKNHEINLSPSYAKTYKEIDNKIIENMELIENNKGNYTEQDHKLIISSLNDSHKNIKSTKIYESVMNSQKLEYKAHDLILISSSPFIRQNTYDVVEVLKKYDDGNLVKYFDNISRANQIYNDVSPYQTYKYRLTPNDDAGDNMYDTEEYEVYESVNQTYRMLTELLYLTELVKEVGDISE